MTEPAFTDDDARVAWDEGAPVFDEFVRSGEDYYRLQVHGPALLETCEPVHGSRALDLGCGQGYFSRQLAVRGGHVTGVDISSIACLHGWQGKRAFELCYCLTRLISSG